ncbi:TPA: hypothetical protein DEP34_01900 [Candidatus Uhrbacteria bacterium]|uniref:DUF4349 domain-containing protein n=2 Tax=Candidatus Uhriibacteriota TaxID=1752732 RepID=A0A0G1SHY6_9BACT|nr:MAG: hypothetical protein UX45_C0010G0014 [Candidatus Uhrbacteria bacterium GW2011_GWF2_46_218]KKU41678.1 MAG: hypothetical protein UX57_C0002G0048 [Candidatus Uhrbacteria bacterium GW2011_GWE2_46_68]HBK33453.1 hypothetical protein [Candidatus Uhrbacteria bacterium]HCB19120.1 hypothetical protein [Candidatus Uhrbacteria bacterium]
MHKHLLRWILIPLGIIVAVIALVIFTAIVVRLSLVATGNVGSFQSESFGMFAGAASAPSTRSFVMNDSLVTYDEATSATDVSQKIIKTGSLTLIVDKVDEAITQTTELTSTLKGFVQSSYVNESENGTKTGSINIRIPSASFEAAIQSLKDLATFVSEESTTGTDVTEEYTDYMARLTTAQAQEAAYLLILNRATTVEEILKVQEALGEIRSEIEVLQGRINYLDDRTMYSTISVSLSEETLITLPSKEFRPWTTVKQAAQAFVVLGQNLINFGIWFVIVGGGLLFPILVLMWIIWKLARRHHHKKH